MTLSDASHSRRSQRTPFIFRLAAGGRRILPRGGVTLVQRSPAASRLRRMLSAAAPDGVRCVDVCGGQLKGAAMFVDLSCEKYYWLGTHEEAVQEALVSSVRRGFVVCDVGAHVGFFTLLASRLAGDSGRVYAIEPRPDNTDRLQRNVEANGARNVDVVAVAASDHDGDAAFIMCRSTLEGRLADEAEGGADLIPDPLGSNTRGLKARATPSRTSVRTATIDGLVREGMAPPDVIKIDVEGAEGAVIRGAARTIDEHRPILLLEVHSRAAGREVIEAMPCRYTFRDLATGIETGAPELPAHYLALPVVGPGRLA